ncbi:MAG: hypothetical protein M3Q07_00600 [Pseudobdellovibrionaceae bacterium]|uniref:hypothetical protein n=1 Tax=Oligoflexus sp. TaxID=1971216 RepID=UPI0027C15F19|nr:hypothetical protein [Oligoflexus sp.]MDQ3230292.1 hypothetical protein [Pseudobdellovibrionaceae bacterium]HYX39043.1 hypothetical protein [Oligoflexus sp.]
MRTELHQKLLANVILSTKSEPLSIKRFRHSATASGVLFYLAASCAAALGLLVLALTKWTHAF